MLRDRPRFGKLHHKLMVIDDAVVVARSLNRAAPRHGCNVFVLGSPFEDLLRKMGGPVDPAAG